jgi:Skp family chaperone for outer membrane proteins
MSEDFDIEDLRAGKRPPEDAEDPLMGGAPSPEEWYRPALTFESEAGRRAFENILINKRDIMAQPDASQLTQYQQEVAQAQREIFDTILDRMGQATDDTAEVVFESPAELNVSLMAANWVYAMLKRKDEDNQTALENIAAIVAMLVEAHWKDADAVYPHLTAVQDAYGGDAADV